MLTAKEPGEWIPLPSTATYRAAQFPGQTIAYSSCSSSNVLRRDSHEFTVGSPLLFVISEHEQLVVQMLQRTYVVHLLNFDFERRAAANATFALNEAPLTTRFRAI